MKKLIVAGASLALLFTPVAPASANPTLPAGDELYEMSCTDAGFQLHSLNTSDNTRTAVGTGTGNNNDGGCGLQGALLPATDWFYFADFRFGQANRLVRADISTGVIEVIGDLREGGVSRDIRSLAIHDNGNAYALTSGKLFSVDLSTGNLTTAVDVLTDGDPAGFAYDPTTDKFYVADSAENVKLYTLNISTGAYSLIATNSDSSVVAMSFDSEGNLWVKGEEENYVSRVAISDFGNSANWIDGAELSPVVDSYSLVIARPASNDEEDADESLANTGSADATPYLVGGLLAAGIALALRRRRV